MPNKDRFEAFVRFEDMNGNFVPIYAFGFVFFSVRIHTN